MAVGEQIQKYRKQNNLTQKELAQILGLAEITIRQYETNKRNPKLQMLRRISKVLNITISDLICDNWEDYKEEVINDFIPIVNNALQNAKITETTLYGDSLVEQITDLLNDFNEKGQLKALDLIKLISKIPEYKKIHK